jgi:hypothetical protein
MFIQPQAEFSFVTEIPTEVIFFFLAFKFLRIAGLVYEIFFFFEVFPVE